MQLISLCRVTSRHGSRALSVCSVARDFCVSAGRIWATVRKPVSKLRLPSCCAV